MRERIAGFRYWQVAFDEHGGLSGSDGDELVSELPGAELTDLFVFSHGWNNDAATARALYEGFFAQVRAVLPESRAAASGLAGVLWPSMRWPDEMPAAVDQGGAASLGEQVDPDVEAIAQLTAVYSDATQLAALDEAAALLATEPSDHEAVERFHELLGVLAAADDAIDAPEDQGEQALLASDPEDLLLAAAELEDEDRAEGAVGIGDAFERMWAGARQALRQVTYWQMKKRAAVVGMSGLAPLIGRLHDASPALRIHLIGHSFGARLVSFSLRGLSETMVGGGSPIKSLTLLQGAFSHFAFAATLPRDETRSGALDGMQGRVDGPILVTHSLFDTAVGELYPWASLVSRDDAAANDDRLYRWGAMGHDGAQRSDAHDVTLAPQGHAYPFAAGKIFNLDSNQVIVAGGPPSGAHGDIFHPELAWAVVSAAALA
jgi:hypothetical protein